MTNTLDDENPGSLRYAIEQSNLSTGVVDTIDFQLGGSQTIAPSVALPAITDPVTIDGSVNGSPFVELDGENITDPNIDGLDITAGNSTIQGLIINRFSGDGIGITGADSNIIQNNFIGTDTAGTSASANGGDGVGIIDSNENQILNNTISGNTGNGVYIAGLSGSNTVAGNNIGNNVTGSAKVANGGDGVLLANATDTTIGGTGIQNTISGNALNGIEIQVTPGFTGSGNHISNNSIGLNSGGNSVIANGNDGILLSGPDTLVDGENAISGNTANGIEILANSDFPNAQGNMIEGNFIGTDFGGTKKFGNGANGILITANDPGQAGNNVIGGTDAGSGNVIAYNAANGVALAKGSPAGTNSGNTIQGNSIFSNGKIGIDLGNDGVTGNDNKDTDVGVNDLQNTPLITSTTANASNNTITGTLNSTPSSHFVVQVFSNAVDAQAAGATKQGTTYLGQMDVNTDTNGNGSFTLNTAKGITTSDYITATATDDDGNTSEFSAGVKGGTQLPPPASITIYGNPISGVEGTTLNNVQLGTFTDSRTVAQANQFTVNIDWGDGHKSTGTVQANGSSFKFFGTNTFLEESQYNVVVTIKDNVNASSRMATIMATIADAPLTAIPKTFNPTQNVQFSGVIGSFSDGNPNAVASEFGMPSIVWGDGHVTNGSIVKSGSVFNVMGTNTYATTGTFGVKISAKDVGGSTTTINSTAKVAGAGITANGSPFTTTHGQPFNARVATFSSGNPNATAGQFSVSILWGDGPNSSNGSVTKSGSIFNAFGGHTYARPARIR